MRLPVAILSVLLVALQYPLWLGHGSMLRVHQLERDVAAEQARNLQQKQSNLALEAEVRNLGSGSEAIEERARADLGMVREGETWFRYASPGNPVPVTGSHKH
ncbi:MAG: cell division protein FtsB [Pseudomonadota bacterium]|nr:cell division protein FtsB [Pseudomonadota bacterium]